VINVWTTTDQKNNKSKSRQSEEKTKFGTVATFVSGGSSSSNIGQGKYTQNSSLALNMQKYHKQPNSSVSQQQQLASSELSSPYFHHHSMMMVHPSSNSASDSQNNYVEIDTLESFLSEQQNEQQQQQQQYSNTVYEINNYKDSNQQVPLDMASPIYENQALVRRSESPIYTNTNHTPIQSTMYSTTSQNLYSNLPTNASSATAAYANLPPSLSLVPASKTEEREG
jgi:hypothetical protein